MKTTKKIPAAGVAVVRQDEGVGWVGGWWGVLKWRVSVIECVILWVGG